MGLDIYMYCCFALVINKGPLEYTSNEEKDFSEEH